MDRDQQRDCIVAVTGTLSALNFFTGQLLMGTALALGMALVMAEQVVEDLRRWRSE